MEVTTQTPTAEALSALTPEEQSQLDDAINKARDGWAHGKQRRIEVGNALITIKVLWDKLDRGKFKREIRDVTNVPYTTSLDYMAEAEEAASTNSVLETEEEHEDPEDGDPPPFQKGAPQDDPQAADLEKLKEDERGKVIVAKAITQQSNQSTLTLYVHRLSPEEREDFKAWQKDNKQTCEALFHEAVMCVLDNGVGAHRAVMALMDLRPATPPPVIQVEETEVTCVQ